jgi:hypothetical protein
MSSGGAPRLVGSLTSEGVPAFEDVQQASRKRTVPPPVGLRTASQYVPVGATGMLVLKETPFQWPAAGVVIVP